MDRTQKIQEFMDFVNSTKFLRAVQFSTFSPNIIINYLQKNSGKIESIIIILKK